MPSYSIPTSSSYYRGKPLSQSGGTGKQDSFKSEEVGRKSGLLDKQLSNEIRPYSDSFSQADTKERAEKTAEISKGRQPFSFFLRRLTRQCSSHLRPREVPIRATISGVQTKQPISKSIPFAVLASAAMEPSIELDQSPAADQYPGNQTRSQSSYFPFPCLSGFQDLIP